VVTLHELLSYRGVSDLIADARHRPWGKTLIPRLVSVDDEVVIVEPWDPLYDQNEIQFISDELAANVVDVGQSFSRLWHHKGIWTPVRA
jgi:hypothetical protein